MVIQSRPIHLLLTRPKAQGMRFARALRLVIGRPLHVCYSPLIEPVFLHPDMPKGGFQAIIFTSETGVASALHMTRLPRLAYCVGDQTALAARKAGFQTRAAAGDAGALIDFILQEKPVGPLLHICGEETRGDVAGRLVFAGIQTHSLIAYRQNPTTLTAAALRLLAGKTPVIVPLFSPRTAQIFATQVELFATAPLYVTAFSLAVAHALEGLAIENLQTATTPTSDAMIAAIRQIADAIPVA